MADLDGKLAFDGYFLGCKSLYASQAEFDNNIANLERVIKKLKDEKENSKKRFKENLPGGFDKAVRDALMGSELEQWIQGFSSIKCRLDEASLEPVEIAVVPTDQLVLKYEVSFKGRGAVLCKTTLYHIYDGECKEINTNGFDFDVFVKLNGYLNEKREIVGVNKYKIEIETDIPGKTIQLLSPNGKICLELNSEKRQGVLFQEPSIMNQIREIDEIIDSGIKNGEVRYYSK